MCVLKDASASERAGGRGRGRHRGWMERERGCMERRAVHQSTGAQMGYCAHSRLKCAARPLSAGQLASFSQFFFSLFLRFEKT